MLQIKQTLPRQDYGVPIRIDASTIPEAANLQDLYYSGHLVTEDSKAEFINDNELIVTIKLKRNGDQ